MNWNLVKCNSPWLWQIAYLFALIVKCSIQSHFCLFLRKHTVTSRCHDGSERWAEFQCHCHVTSFVCLCCYVNDYIWMGLWLMFQCCVRWIFCLCVCICLSLHQQTFFVTDLYMNPKRDFFKLEILLFRIRTEKRHFSFLFWLFLSYYFIDYYIILL